MSQFTAHATRVSVPFAGDVDTAITVHDDPDDLTRTWLSVRTGPVLTYCRQPGAVVDRSTAWAEALGAAVRVLPAQFARPGAMDEHGVTVLLDAMARETWTVDAIGKDVRPDRIPVVLVRIGAITARCYDQTAVNVVHAQWIRAAALATVLWQDRHPRRALVPAAR